MSAVEHPKWDPNIYLQFGGERTRAAADLLARVPLLAPRRIVDLGCGPGNSTALIASRYPGAEILGVDADEAMLRQAKAAAINADFEAGDFETWTPRQAPDLIYTNAALHWAPDPLARGAPAHSRACGRGCAGAASSAKFRQAQPC